MTDTEHASPAGQHPGDAAGAFDQLHRAVLARLEADRLDPAIDGEAVEAAIADAVEAYQRRAHLGAQPTLRDPDEMTARLLRSITGFGPLTELLARPDVEEIFLEGANVAYLDATGRLQGLAAPTSETANRHVVEQLLASTQRTLDARSPLVQARVLDGRARLTAAIPPIADTLSATIRRHTLRRDTLASLVDRDTLTPAAADFLAAISQTTASVVVSGPPGAGKTSLLSALIAAAPPDHCIRCCEEIRELNVALTHGSFYEARPPAMDGNAEVSLRDLVKFTLAMRPDHLVVGEVRGAEAFELTRATNAGCGFGCTRRPDAQAAWLPARSSRRLRRRVLYGWMTAVQLAVVRRTPEPPCRSTTSRLGRRFRAPRDRLVASGADRSSPRSLAGRAHVSSPLRKRARR